MRLLDALFRRKIPVCPDAPDADAPDEFYQHPVVIGTFIVPFYLLSIYIKDRTVNNKHGYVQC